jgi:glycosyltransferase involved in cell wall biosynthesis
LILIGEGPERKRLIQLVERLGLQNVVEFKGGIPQTQLADYYRASDVFILPSIRTKRGEEEAFGLVLAEAMASGLPVIGTRTGGISSLIEDQKTGLMVEEGDPPGVAAAIRRILCEGALRDRLVQGGMEKVKEKCEWNHIASRFDQIFQQVKGPHSSMGQED